MTARGTLSSQLRSRVTLVVAVLAVFLSAGVLLAASSILYGQLDDQLDAAQERQQRAVSGGYGDRAPGIDVPGMSQGTIVVAVMPNGSVRGNTIGQGTVEPLTVDAANALLEVDDDGRKHTVNVPGMGKYRVEARSYNLRVVVALPLENVQQSLGWLALFAGGLGLVSVAVAAVATRATADAATKPLRALGQASVEVARLPLHTGEVSVPTRVAPPADLPPTHEVAQLTTAFNHMLANVEGALAARQASETKLRRFVADASHELRNPLAAIRGYSELADRTSQQDGADAARDTAFALGRISSESTRMTKLVNDLLLLARLDADLPSEPRPVDLVETVLNAVSDSRAAGPTHSWKLELPPTGIQVLADADQLHQVVVNLLANARTHTPEGTTVTTSVAMADGWARLTVVDDGPGIPADVLPRVFERFSRADAARTHTSARSTGLGLAIVQAVVTRFGGQTMVESQPGRTCFTVLLPVAPAT
ncbi:HAMP domain-containing sensor histidine kinase [Tessaracoccus terricola]